MQPTLKTDRLLLRPYVLADAADVQRLAGDRRIADTTTHIPHPYEPGQAEQWISPQEAHFGDGTGVVFAVTCDEALIGTVGLMHISNKHARAELGYWIGVPFWGQGYCTEAVCALLDFAHHQLGLTRIDARCFARNAASARVLEKCGFLHEGTLRRHVRKWGRYEDVLFYGRLFPDRGESRQT